MDVDLVLTPVDGSHESERAADYALAVASRYGADLHLLHLLDGRVLERLAEGHLSARTVAKQQLSFTDEIRDQAGDRTVVTDSTAVGFSPDRLALTPGNVILDSAEELSVDFLVVPRVTVSESPDTVLGTAALHVLEYASQPVLSV